MPKLEWDLVGERTYETGVSQGALFVSSTGGVYGPGVAWNGLTGISESPEGGEPTALYADDIKYLELMSAENFKGTISAYTYPEEFEACDGSIAISEGVNIGLQPRKRFGLVYKSKLGNDVEGNTFGEKLHIIYGCMVAPSERAYSTVNDSPEAITFSWDFTATPVAVPGYNPSAQFVFNSTTMDKTKWDAINDLVYGTATNPAKLPTPEEIIALVSTTRTAKLSK